jgi:hypothetical protein
MGPLEIVILFAFPVCMLVSFLGLTMPIATTYWLTELLWYVPRAHHAGPRTLHQSAVRWWQVMRSLWPVSRRHALRKLIVHPFFLVLSVLLAALAGMGASFGVAMPYVFVRQLLDRPASISYLVVLTGITVGVLLLFDCAGYALWPRRRRLTALPGLDLPESDLAYRRRLSAAREVYCYLRTRVAVNVSVLLGPVSLLVGAYTAREPGRGDDANPAEGLLVIASFLT